MDINAITDFIVSYWGWLLYFAGSIAALVLTFYADAKFRKAHPEIKDYEDAPAALSIALLFSWGWVAALAIGKIMSLNDAPDNTGVNKENEQIEK